LWQQNPERMPIGKGQAERLPSMVMEAPLVKAPASLASKTTKPPI
jgi:hypothetical protein